MWKNHQTSKYKLQKLLYYTQGFHLAIYGVPLFEEKLIAWEHGPVVKEVYDKFKEFGSNAISVPDTKITLNKKVIAKFEKFNYKK